MYRFKKYMHNIRSAEGDNEFKKLRKHYTHKLFYVLVISLLIHAAYFYMNEFMLPFYFELGICVLLLFLLFNFPHKLYQHFTWYIAVSYALFISLTILYYLMEVALFDAHKIRNNTIIQHSILIIYGYTIIAICLSGWYFHRKSRLYIRIYKRKFSKLTNETSKKEHDPQNTFLLELSELIDLAKNDDISLIPRFNSVYPLFYDKVWALNPKLSTLEYKCCILLFLKFSTKDIASSNNLSVRSVQTRKNRLRKNFDLSADTDLYDWIANL